MPQEPSAVEQAVSRALRDNLSTVQRTAEELRAAVDDLVAACASAKPTNAIPPMVRAQTAAASLAACLEVLTRFVATSLQPPQRTPAEEAILRAVSVPMPVAEPAPAPPPSRIPTPMAEVSTPPPVEVVPPPPRVVEPPPPPPPPEPEMRVEPPAPEPQREPPPPPPPPPAAAPAWDLKSLPFEEQEMHRKANRHAKVSMQDIKMYKKNEVKQGQENFDLCTRLREDIDKARKEYDRRFKSILDHPVDYFYDWMVAILADGDAEKLGKYPYPSRARRD